MDPHELKPPGPGLLSNSTTNVAATGQQQQLGVSGDQLNLPPPSPQGSGTSGISGAIGSLTSVSSAGGSVGSCANNVNIFYSNVAASHQQRPSPNNTNNDADSDTESLASMSAKAKAAAAAEQNHNVSATNGHNCGANTAVNNLSVNAKQQRQQKRRRERAQRLQAERENRFANTVNNIPNSGLLYHASSAGSMGEDSNNSNGNFTSSSNGSNHVMPPTDSIASLLLNPPHSPECNSGLMATPSDSEGESLDEDLLSTSSSSTLLLPRDKPPPRPPPPVRRKLPRSPVLEEEIIDGFAILEFKSYEDLEYAIKLGQKRKEKRLSALEELTCTYSIEETKMPKIIDTGQPHPIRGSGVLNLPINNIKDASNNIRLHSGNGNSTNCHPAQTVTSATPVTVQDTPLDVIAPPWKSQYQNSNNNVGSHISNINQNTLNCSSASGNILNNTSINTAPPTTMILNHNGNNSSNSNNNSDGAGSSSSSSSSGIAETTSSNINNTDEDAVMASVDATDDCRSVLTAMDSGASSGSSTMAANPIIDNASKSKESNTTNSRTSTVTNDVSNVTSVSSPISTFSVPPPAALVSASASTTILDKCSSSSVLANSTTQAIPTQPPAPGPAPISDGYRNAMHLESQSKISSNSASANKSPMDVAFSANSGSNSKSSSHFISMTSNVPNATQLGNSNNSGSGEMATDMRGSGSTATTAATVASAAQQSAPKIAQPTPTKDEVFDRIRDAGVTCKSMGMGLNICDNDENKGSERLGPIVFPSTPTQHIANATPSPTTPRKSSDYPQQATGVSIKNENNESFPAPIVSAVAGVGPAVGAVGGVASSAVPGMSPAAIAQQNKDNIPLGKNSSQTTVHSADGMAQGSGVHSPMVQTASSSGPPTPVHTTPVHTNEKPPSGSSAQQQMQQQHHQQQQQQHQQLHSPQQPTPMAAGVQHQPNLPPPFSTPSHQVSTEARNLVPSSPATQHIDSPFAPKLTTNPVGAHLATSPINASMHAKSLPPTQGNGAQSSVAPISMMPAPITTTVTQSPTISGFGVNSRLGPAPPMHHLQSGFSSVPATNASVGAKPVEVTGTSEVPMPKSIAAPPPVMNGFLPGFMPGSASAQNSVRISAHMGHMAPVTSGMPPISVVPLTTTSTAPTTGIAGSVTNSNVTVALPATVAASSAAMAPVTMSSMPKGPYVVSATPASTMSSSATAPSHGMFVQANPAIALPGAPPMLGGVPNGIAPMLIHSPYRTPYPGYPLYAPYSGLPHSPYLPPAVPSPNASPRTIDTRTGREITSVAPSPKVISAGMRPVTPVSSSSSASVAPVSCSGGTTIAAPPPPAALSSVQMPMSGLPPGSVPGPGLPPGQQTTHLLHHLPYGANPHGPPQSVANSGGFPMSIGTPNNSHIYSSGANSSGNNTNTTTTASIPNATALSGNSNSGNGNSSSGAHSSSSGSMGGGNSTIQLQRGDSSHLLPPPPPHMLTHPNLPPPPPSHVAGGPHMAPIPHMLMHPQHGMLRGISPSTANTNSSNSSALPLIGGPTSSSVIQRVISPKSENPSRERDIAYSIPRSAPSINTHSSASNSAPTGAPPYMTTAVSSSSVGSAMPVPYSSSTVSALHTMHSHPTTTMASPHQHIATPPSLPYPPKNPLWPSSSLQLTPSTTATISTSASASLATRPTPPPAPPQSALNVVSASAASSAAAAAGSMPANSASPQTTHSGPGAVSTFQPSFFITPLPPPPPTVSASAMSSSATTPSTSLTVASGAATIVGSGPAPIGAAASSSSVSTSQTTVTTATSTPVTTAAPHPFSAESLFQTSKNDQADLLRRELDSRFLDRSGLAVQPPAQPPPSTYLRQELHHHQHQHTHLHQHQQLIPAALPAALPAAPPPAPAPIFPQLFKDIPKIAAVDTPFYRTGIGLPGYPGYNSGLLHPGLGGATPFMPPGHLTSFAPKKTGRWNAMHVRIAWEIYYNQNKQNPDKLANTQLGVAGGNPVGIAQGGVASSLSSAGSVGPSPSSSVTLSGLKTSPALSLSSASPHLLHRPGELPPGAMAAYAGALPGRSPFETSPLSTSFIGAPPSHIGTAVSPFGRYAAPFGFGLSHFGCETWRPLQRAVPYHPGATSAPMWPLKPDPALDNARREAEEREREREREREMREREQRERERQRREREERERKEKEEKLKREQQERERERERKERERRELERRELERERMLQQQRINESNKLSQAAAAAAAMSNTQRDRSPHRNHNDPLGGPSVGEIRIKEEHPRTKEEQDAMLMRASAAAAAAGDARYHQSIAVAQASAAAAAHHASFMAGRHGPHGVGPPPPPHLARSMMPQALGGPPMSHFGPPGPPGWPMDPYRDPYAPMLRYNIMEALRHEEERHKVALSMYAAQSAAHLRGKEPSPIPPPSVGGPLGPPPPPPHHRIQQSPHHQQAGGVPPPPTIIGKPPTLGGMPHPIAVDGHHPSKKEDGGPNVGVSGMQTAPSPSASGR